MLLFRLAHGLSDANGDQDHKNGRENNWDKKGLGILLLIKNNNLWILFSYNHSPFSGVFNDGVVLNLNCA